MNPREASIDQFFALLSGRETPSRPTSAAAAPVSVAIEPSPSLSPQADSQAVQEWMREEKQRLESYMQKQFATLKQQREELTAWRSQVEQALVAREQELNRHAKLLTARGEALQQREQELAAHAAELEAVRVRLISFEQEVKDLEEKHTRLSQEIEGLSVQRDQACGQVAEQEALAQAVLQQAHDRLATLDQREEQVRRREEGLAQREQAIQRRGREIEDLEDAIRQELEEREQEMVAAGRELEERRQELVGIQHGETKALRAKVMALSREVETLRRTSVGRGQQSA
jgi:chromosome segregation ATPase